MNIKINLTNRYGYELAVHPYNGGAFPEGQGERIAQKEGKGVITLASGENSILIIPGMDSLLIQFMGNQRLENIHERFRDTPDEFDQYEQMALLRYKTTELYWRFPGDDDAALELSINDIGTVCLDKVLTGEVRQVSLPEFFIPPVFCDHGPEGVVEAVSNSDQTEQ
ncbi:hypothetical protein [Pseudoalteromonas sp. OOF1S-7]|uniref:hypothetical protein n=1 Tax=Pseudoalteromonas sp. OOF1S-7 TaxID=2917757 RepID=UPI001EF51E46|nr:hypothetical protein [Pseudoalteromonas sp. OOF1S-7]MCG7534315.1 hypothetical protein [Pseudoalteromonas sp. OOF1S-7]